MSKPANLWVFIFAYTVLTGLLVQLVLLPYVAPSWHDGDGLLKGYDAPEFHRVARVLSESIRSEGWRQWELLPHGKLVSGVAAIFYVLIHPAPWSVLGMNGALNASVCVCFYFLISKLAGDRRIGLLSALPFMLFPSALLWNAQLHNENYAVPGVIFVLYGWSLIAGENWKNQERVPSGSAAAALAFIVAGSLLLGLVRSYILSGLILIFALVPPALVIYWLFGGWRGRPVLVRAALAGTGFVLMAMSLLVVKWDAASENISIGEAIARAYAGNTVAKPGMQWRASTWLPGPIDLQLKEITAYRKDFVGGWAGAGSAIDLDVTFSSAEDVFAYAPRALQIAFFAPFPDIWFTPGRKAAGGAMRAESALEMLIAYFCLAGLPLFMWRHRKSPAVWVCVLVCTGMLVVYATTIPNQGALYRFRFPYYMPLISLGLAGWLERRPAASPPGVPATP